MVIADDREAHKSALWRLDLPGVARQVAQVLGRQLTFEILEDKEEITSNGACSVRYGDRMLGSWCGWSDADRGSTLDSAAGAEKRESEDARMRGCE